MPLIRLWSSWSMLFMLAYGCPKKAPPADPVQDLDNRVLERVTDAEQGLVEQDVDYDEDGVTDIRNHFRERPDAPRLLLKKEQDLNFDGNFDIVTVFDDEGKLLREEIDSDYDGRFDWTDHYKRGLRVMSEYDTDNDGQANVFKYYVEGEDGNPRIDRKERDEDGDGQIDVWERFSADGQVVRTGRDTDGDGKVDERME